MSQLLQRAYYQGTASEFVALEDDAILGELVSAHSFATDVLQRGAWQHQIKALKRVAPQRTFTSNGLTEFSLRYEFN